MQLKDILGISLISIFVFPVLLIGVMLMMGLVHLEIGGSQDKERLRESLIAAEATHQEDAEAKQLKAYKALASKEVAIDARESELSRESERLENLKLEMAREKDAILKHRSRIEQLVLQDVKLQDKQIAALAEVYGAMKPDEAAPILLSLKDSLVVRILKKIPETRSTSKLLAALAALDVRRAANITEMMGKGNTGVTAEPKAKPEEAVAAPTAKPNTENKKPATEPANAPANATGEKTKGKA